MRAKNMREWNPAQMQKAKIGAWLKYDGVHYLKLDQGKWAYWENTLSVRVSNNFWSEDYEEYSLRFDTIERAPRRKMKTLNADGRYIYVDAPRTYEEGVSVSTTMTDMVLYLLGKKEAHMRVGDKVIFVNGE
jgi:hypothetical protein